MPQAFLDPGPPPPEGTEQPQGQPPCQVGAEPAAGQWKQRTKPSSLAAWRPGLELASHPELPLRKKGTNGEQKARGGIFSTTPPTRALGLARCGQLGAP